jgi:hypothetical protein
MTSTGNYVRNIINNFLKPLCNNPPKDLYKGIIGQWSTILDIIYSDEKKGVQRFEHVYEFLEPSYISDDQKIVFGRIVRLSDPDTATIIQKANNVFDPTKQPEGFYNIHHYFLRWDEKTCRYIGKKIDVDDSTFADFFFSGGDFMRIFSHEVSQSKEFIDNAHVADLRLYKMDCKNKIPMPSYEKIYNKKSNDLTPVSFSKDTGSNLEWTRPFNQIKKNDILGKRRAK